MARSAARASLRAPTCRFRTVAMLGGPNPGEDALVPYRLRTVAIGVQMTLLVLVTMVMFPLLPGHGDLRLRPYGVVIAVAALGAVVIPRLPWERMFHRGLGL